MAMLQLDPLIPVLVKHKGEWVKAMAHVLIDYGFEHNLMFVCFADESRECWTVETRTSGRRTTSRPGACRSRRRRPPHTKPHAFT